MSSKSGVWPTGAELTKYLSGFKMSELVKKHSDCMLKAQKYFMDGDYNLSDKHRKNADTIVLHCEKFYDDPA